MKDGATLLAMAALSTRSRRTGKVGKKVNASERVVEIPRAWIASPARYSRIELRTTASPSALREKGVLPEPFI